MWRVVRKPWKLLRFALAVLRLHLCRDSATRLLARALRAAAFGTCSAEEAEWRRRIEEVRRELSGSVGTRESPEWLLSSADAGPVAPLECFVAKSPFWALVLFRLVRTFRPDRCLEMGTGLGVSGAYQAAALQLNGAGTLVTVEGRPERAAVAERSFEHLDLQAVSVCTGRFQDVLSDVLRERAPIDYAFVDGHHDEQATIDYFEEILPLTSDGAVLVFDDIRWSPGMKRAWRTIARSPAVRRAVDLHEIGICIVSPER